MLPLLFFLKHLFTINKLKLNNTCNHQINHYSNKLRDFNKPKQTKMAAAAISPTTTTITFLHHRHNDTSSLHRSSSLSLTSSHRTISSSSVLHFTPKCLANPLFSAPATADKKKLSVQTEAVRQLTGSLTKAQGHRFAIVIARFNEIVTRPLMNGALDTFDKYSVREEDIDVIWVPGAFEIGLVAEKLGKSGKYNAILCIGAVVRGDTTHYDAVANSAASGVLSAGLNSGVPCIFGVLTCEDMDQALNRAGGKAGNKGSEAALTAIEMASLFEHHLKE